jgi:L-iditol 2-dehydrogenase
MSAFMQAAVLHGPGDLRIEEVPVPVLGAGDALVAVDGVGLCGSDLHYYRHGRNGANVVDRPAVLGHEVAGTVVATGDAVPTGLRRQRVVIEPAHWCGRCEVCRQGRYNLCPHGWCLGSPPTPGGLATYVSAPARLLHLVPTSLDPSVLPLLEPLAVAVHAVRRADLRAGQSVLVCGAGPVGLLVAQAAKICGAGDVTVSDVNAGRLRSAHHYGADHAVHPDELIGPFDRVLECSGAPAAVGAALGVTCPGGRVVLVGTVPDGDVASPVSIVQRREVDVVGSFRYADAFPTAIEWASEERVDLAELVTDTYPLAQSVEAFARAASGAGLKTVVLCHGPRHSDVDALAGALPADG